MDVDSRYPLEALRQKVIAIAELLPGTWQVTSAEQIRRQRNIVIKRNRDAVTLCFEFTQNNGVCYMPIGSNAMETGFEMRQDENIVAKALLKNFRSTL